MSLARVIVSEAVAGDCFLHALTTEREEVMGLLLGDIEIIHADGIDVNSIPQEMRPKLRNVKKIARVWGCRAIHRSDKRPDRVEIPPELMCNITDEAEELTRITGTRTRVIGWYHSHPNITPYPSHVDLATQATYQFIESGWVGLIFSVFHADRRNNGRLELHCFQTAVSSSGANEHLKVPVGIARSDTFLPSSVAKAFPPLTQCAVLADVIIAESRQNLQGVMDAFENGSGQECDAELKAILHGVYQQQLYKLKHSFLLPTLHSAVLFNNVLRAREEEVDRELAVLEAKEAEVRQRITALQREQEVSERGLDALLS